MYFLSLQLIDNQEYVFVKLTFSSGINNIKCPSFVLYFGGHLIHNTNLMTIKPVFICLCFSERIVCCGSRRGRQCAYRKLCGSV